MLCFQTPLDDKKLMMFSFHTLLGFFFRLRPARAQRTLYLTHRETPASCERTFSQDTVFEHLLPPVCCELRSELCSELCSHLCSQLSASENKRKVACLAPHGGLLHCGILAALPATQHQIITVGCIELLTRKNEYFQ